MNSLAEEAKRLLVYKYCSNCAFYLDSCVHGVASKRRMYIKEPDYTVCEHWEDRKDYPDIWK